MAATTTTHNTGARPGPGPAGTDTGGQSGGGGRQGGMSGAMRPHAQPDHREGIVARSIEHYTAQLPSDLFLWAAVGSIGLSLLARMSGNKEDANFFGQWAPTFLILGLYNKVVKVAGSDPQHRGMSSGSPQMMSRGAGI